MEAEGELNAIVIAYTNTKMKSVVGKRLEGNCIVRCCDAAQIGKEVATLRF
jgi:hypothetical protein